MIITIREFKQMDQSLIEPLDFIESRKKSATCHCRRVDAKKSGTELS